MVNFLVISGSEDFRYAHSAEFQRPCVVRMVYQQSLLKRVLDRRFLTSEDTGNQPRDSLDDCQSREFSSRENEVAEGDLIPLEPLADPLVEAFVSPTEKQNPLLLRKFGGHLLVEGASPRAQENTVVGTEAVFHLLNSFKDRSRFEHHARPSTKRAIIHLEVAIPGELPEVHKLKPDMPRSLCLSQDAVVQISPNGVWKQRKNREKHEAPQGRKGS